MRPEQIKLVSCVNFNEFCFDMNIDLHTKTRFGRNLICMLSMRKTWDCSDLIKYLIGNQDFYKVIKGRNKVEIQAYNLHGTLNLPFGSIKPKAKVSKLKLPTRLIEVVFQENSKTTL